MAKDRTRGCPDCDAPDIGSLDMLHEKGNGLCSHCHGERRVTHVGKVFHVFLLPTMDASEPCLNCDETGQCQTCGGTGYQHYNEEEEREESSPSTSDNSSSDYEGGGATFFTESGNPIDGVYGLLAVLVIITIGYFLLQKGCGLFDNPRHSSGMPNSIEQQPPQNLQKENTNTPIKIQPSQNNEDDNSIPSQEWVLCNNCKGIGHIEEHSQCQSCNGIGKISYQNGAGQMCANCNGIGSFICPNCKNSGGFTSCPNCNRAGYYPCNTCGQTGYIRYNNDYSEKCSNCNGKGKLVCENCRGKGGFVCNNCNGNRKFRCSNCNGTGYLQQNKTSVSCENCAGSGQNIIRISCSNCNGNGQILVTKE